MKWVLAALLMSACARTPAGVYCEGITAETKLSTLPTREFIPANEEQKAFWALEARYLFDDASVACCVTSRRCRDESYCEALLASLRVAVLDTPFSTDCGIGGWGMCHVIFDASDRIVATTYRCQD